MPSEDTLDILFLVLTIEQAPPDSPNHLQSLLPDTPLRALHTPFLCVSGALLQTTYVFPWVSYPFPTKALLTCFVSSTAELQRCQGSGCHIIYSVF